MCVASSAGALLLGRLQVGWLGKALEPDVSVPGNSPSGPRSAGSFVCLLLSVSSFRKALAETLRPGGAGRQRAVRSSFAKIIQLSHARTGHWQGDDTTWDVIIAGDLGNAAQGLAIGPSFLLKVTLVF